MKLRRIFPAVLGLSIIGCSSSTTTTTTSGGPSATRKPPAYVAFVNLTSDALDISTDGIAMASAIGPYEACKGYIVGLKDHKISGSSGAKTGEGAFKGEAGSLTIIVVKSEGGKLAFETVKGVSSVVPESGSRIVCINLASKSVKFGVGGEKFDVATKAVKEQDGAAGPQSVTVQGSSVDVEAKDKEIWGVFCLEKDGKIQTTSIRLKGPLKVEASSAASS